MSAVITPENEGWVWHPTDWQFADEASVRDARTITRGKARADFAHCNCPFTDVGAWKRYVRGLSRQEQYEHWVECQDGGWDHHPDLMPDDWDAWKWDEDIPAWEFCLPDHPEAVPVWICGLLSDGAPHRPRRTALASKETRDA